MRARLRTCHVTLWSWFDLSADDPRSAELSAAAWEERTRTLWCIQDESADIVALTPDAEMRTWKFGAVVRPQVGGLPLDAEGLVVTDDGFIFSSEIGPRIVEIDRSGKYRRDIPIPAKFTEARENKSFESLTASPDGRYLFTTTETALPRDDGRLAPTTGAHVRLLRLDRATGATVERAYVTDRMPQCADFGIADLTSLGGDDLLVLERGWTKGFGNIARIYRVDFGDDSATSNDVEHLAETAPVLTKALLLDLSSLPVTNIGLPPPKQAQPSPLMDNFEGIGVGPLLPDGRPSLLLVSDDNNRNDQVARVLVLAVNWGP